MCFMACTLWPPHSAPAPSSSFFAVCKLCSARSTSAGLSFCGLENRVADGDSIITENSNRVAIFIVSLLLLHTWKCLDGDMQFRVPSLFRPQQPDRKQS